MINTNMRYYDFFLLGEKDSYGQEPPPKITDTPEGIIKIAINISSQSIQDNINYKGCNYIGLTKDTITEKYFIKYENQLLKVLYINPMGKYKQIFLSEV